MEKEDDVFLRISLLEGFDDCCYTRLGFTIDDISLFTHAGQKDELLGDGLPLTKKQAERIFNFLKIALHHDERQ
jgi:hypothetical protein